MSDSQSITHLEDLPPLQRSLVSDIQGEYIGNTGSSNINYPNTNSGNTAHSGYAAINYSGNATSYPSDPEILQCLYTSTYESHRGRVRGPAEGTCTWVTNHPKYKQWSARKESALLWLTADPGCGKSVIASFLVNHLETRPDAIVCYFFFKDDSEDQRSATFALCAILHQLFEKRSTLCRYAEKALRGRGTGFTEQVDTLWEILVKAVAEAGCGEVICVVDALDECEQGTRAQLIHRLARLPLSEQSNTPLKFLVTSRPYYDIATSLGTPTTTIRLRGEDEINATTADVSRVIDQGIGDLERYWEVPGELGYLRNLLESSADRTFLWVSLVLEALKDSENDSQARFTEIASTTPRDLPELYTKILNKARDPDEARRILHIVVGAARPLTLREIDAAFKIRRDHATTKDLGDLSPRFEMGVKNMCGLFVRIIDSQVYLIHQGAREFLIKGTLPVQGNWQYTFCPMDSNFILADICISYLSLQDFENDYPMIETLGASTSARGEAAHNYPGRHALLDYAASHWAEHFRDSRDRQMELFERTKLICKGGTNRFLTWFRVYWENSGQEHQPPNDFTHLMLAAWLGQRSVVKKLLKEGESVNTRSEIYGTALNIAALRKEKDIAKMLINRRANAYLNGKEYNILLTSKNELIKLEKEDERTPEEMVVIEFLKPFCIQGISDLHTLPSRIIKSLR